MRERREKGGEGGRERVLFRCIAAAFLFFFLFFYLIFLFLELAGKAIKNEKIWIRRPDLKMKRNERIWKRIILCLLFGGFGLEEEEAGPGLFLRSNLLTAVDFLSKPDNGFLIFCTSRNQQTITNYRSTRWSVKPTRADIIILL